MIVGATSPIARASAAAFARRGHDLYLAGRDMDELQRIAADLRVRYGTRIACGAFDAEAYETHGDFLKTAADEMGEIAGALLAFGYLGDPMQARRFEYGSRIIHRNFTGAASLLSHLADYFENRKHGFIAGISSVAGERGRQSNYVYGAAKGAFTILLQGLRNRLFPHGVRVLTVKPGFVDTGMTFGMRGLFLVASPEYVGERIARSVVRGRDVVYIPWFWRHIMLIIRLIPEFIFKRLKL